MVNRTQKILWDLNYSWTHWFFIHYSLITYWRHWSFIDVIDYVFITHWLLLDVIDYSFITHWRHWLCTPYHWLVLDVIDCSVTSLIMHSFPIDNSFTWWLFIDVVDYALINHSRHFPPFLTKINKIRSHNLWIWFLIRYYFKLVLSSR